MTDNTPARSLDDIVFGYELYPETSIREDGKIWFEFCDGRVGKESDMRKAVALLLETVREANTLADGKGYIGDFDYMLGREMHERSDLLLSDKFIFDATLRKELNVVMPGLGALGKEYDLGLALTAYAQISHERGAPRPPAQTFMERLRDRIADRVTEKDVVMAVTKAAAVYSDEMGANRLMIGPDRREEIENTIAISFKELSKMGIDLDEIPGITPDVPALTR